MDLRSYFSLLIWVVHYLGVRMPRFLKGFLLSTGWLTELGSQELSQIFTIIILFSYCVLFMEMTFRSLERAQVWDATVIVKVTRLFFWYLLASLSVFTIIIWFLAHVPLEEIQETYRHKLENSQALEEFILESMRSDTKRVLLWLLSQLE